MSDKLKIAFCFSGHLRYVEEGVKYWKSIIEKYDADVYGSFWDISDSIENKIKEDPDNKKLKFENEYYKYLFIEELKPKKIEFEKLENFRKSTTKIYLKEVNPPWVLKEVEFNHALKAPYFDMWYKIWRSNLLSKDIDYDIVIRTRIDIFFDNLIIEKNDFINIPSTSMIWNRDFKNCIGPVDVFAYSNSENMDYYCSLYLYLTRYLKEGHYVQPCENILKVHLAQRNFIVNVLDSKFYLFRDPNFPFCPSSKSYIYSSKLDISTDEKWSFYKKYDPDFFISYSIKENKIYIHTEQKIRVYVLIFNVTSNELIYSSLAEFDYNSLWFSPINSLNTINNIRIEIRDICDTILKEQKLELK